jgi:hypothetical protein
MQGLQTVERIDRFQQRIDRLLPDRPPDSNKPKDLKPFGEWLRIGSPGWPWHYKHLKHIRQALTPVESGQCKRLMIFVPPRHCKSEMVTVRFSAYMLEKDPSTPIIIGAYDYTLATKFNRKARRIARQQGIALDQERQAVDDWLTIVGGGIRAAGVGGGITGHGGKLIIIDDPIKSREEANSLTYRERTWNWYRDDLYTRLEPGGIIVLIMTRWHEDDLAGRILASEDGPNWTVIRLPSLAETQEERDEYSERIGRPTGEPDPIGRDPGQPLNPERFPNEEVEHTRQVMGNSFYALHQQRPAAAEGDMFKRAWFDIVPVVPKPTRICIRLRYWDKAGTKDAGAFTAGLMLEYVDGTFFISGLIMGQRASAEREKVIQQTAHADAAKYGRFQELDDRRRIMQDPGHVIAVEQEPGSGGKESAENTITSLPGFIVYADRPTGDKVLRAEPVASQAEIGNIKLVRAAWNTTLLGIYYNPWRSDIEPTFRT